jgi:hypothetical protein
MKTQKPQKKQHHKKIVISLDLVPHSFSIFKASISKCKKCDPNLHINKKHTYSDEILSQFTESSNEAT